jgi:DinB family protein
MHTRLEEILAYLASVRAELAAEIVSRPKEAFTVRPAEGRWTGAEIIYHLGNAEGATTKMLERVFEKALADGIPTDPETSSLVHSLDHLGVPDRGARRIVAPERLEPPPGADLPTSWESLQRVRERTHRAVATVDGRDLTTLSAPHPIFGPINGYQWILFIGQHEARHLDQLRETLAQPSN